MPRLASLAKIAVLASAPLVAQALTLINPGSWNDSAINTVTWATIPGDPATISVSLENPKLLPSGPLQILDTVPSSQLTEPFNLPAVPTGENYTIVAFAVGSSTPISTAGPFSIVESRIPRNASSSSSGTSTATVTSPAQPTQNPTVPTPPSSIVFPNSPSSSDTSFSGAVARFDSPSSAVVSFVSLALLGVAGVGLVL